MTRKRFNWTVLQTGDLPLRPDGGVRLDAEHRCTSILLWPEGQAPAPDNTLVTDPCILGQGVAQAVEALESLGLTWADVGHYFVTHPHWDHELDPNTRPAPSRFLRAVDKGPFAGLKTAPCPGHHPWQQALVFPAAEGAIWVVGDAVLDEAWLRAWGYYWPNMYGPREVVQTWLSLDRILAGADVIVPGHGPPIPVTAELVAALLETFPGADYADRCPQVADILRERLAAFSDG